MAGNILTPITIWKDFDIAFIPPTEIIDTEKQDKVTYTRLYIHGQVGKEAVTKIFATLAKPEKRGKIPTVLLLQDFEFGYDKLLVDALIEQGYAVLSIDLAGKTDKSQFYTVYPDSIDYANYSAVKDKLCVVERDATHTCWYEWARATRFALKFLLNENFVSRVGGFAAGEVATALWQVAGSCNELSCVTFALNAGWRGYRGINKFGGDVEPQFSDEMYKFIAGIEPQAYAMHIKCPVLMLSATNSRDFDCDRACDTVTRITDGVFKAVHYSVGYRERVSGEAFRVATVFLDEFLKKEKTDFCANVDISCEIIAGKVCVDITADGLIKSVDLYASEEISDPAKRCWQKVCGGVKKENGVYSFEYLPYHNSVQVTFFGQVTYKNGFVAGTRIINKKFTEKDVLPSHKSKILYSSRLCNSEVVFSAAKQDLENSARINLQDKKRVTVKKGPMGIEGVCCKWGLLTFKFATEKDRPSNDALLMFDVYSKNVAEMQVKLIADYFGAKVEYCEKVKLVGGDVWQNVKIAINKYKTIEGMGLKSYDKIEVVEFLGDEEFIINNALWV